LTLYKKANSQQWLPELCLTGFANLLYSHQVNFDVHHRFNAASRMKGRLMYEQKLYGLSGAGAAVFYEYRL
jgi:hypothetical protein